MGYEDWFTTHADKHKKIIEKLLRKNFSKEQIIEYFDFDNMKKEEIEFCPLYKEDKKCHDMESLNCYLCACPNFRFSDDGIEKTEDATQYSFCDINSKDGVQATYGEAVHQDCSKCSVPHHKEYVNKHFDLEWKQIMQNCNLSSLK